MYAPTPAVASEIVNPEVSVVVSVDELDEALELAVLDDAAVLLDAAVLDDFAALLDVPVLLDAVDELAALELFAVVLVSAVLLVFDVPVVVEVDSVLEVDDEFVFTLAPHAVKANTLAPTNVIKPKCLFFICGFPLHLTSL